MNQKLLYDQGVLYTSYVRFALNTDKKLNQNQLQNSLINIQNYIFVKLCRNMRKIGKNMQNLAKVCINWKVLAKISKIIRNYRNYQRNLAEVDETKWSSGLIVNNCTTAWCKTCAAEERGIVWKYFFVFYNKQYFCGGRGEERELFLRYGSWLCTSV